MVVAFATHPGTARAEDVAAEIHLLKEQVKQLEPLKERLKQLEAEVAKEKRERKEARGGVRNAAVQPGPGTGFVCKGAACPPPPAIVCKDGPCPPPPPVFVSFTNGLKVESLDQDFSFRIGGRIYMDGGAAAFPRWHFWAQAPPAVPASIPTGRASVRPARRLRYIIQIWDYKSA